MSKINYVNNLITGMEAEMFIIPNRAISITDDKYHSYKVQKLIEWYNQFCALNGTTFNAENDKLIDINLVEIDPDKVDTCDSMQVYPFCIETINMDSWIEYRWIPEKLLSGIKEGDTFTLNFPIKLISCYDHFSRLNVKDAVLKLNITANQKYYRYKRFPSTFEESLKKVTS